MEALRTALALLVTLEARITEVVDPAQAQADMLKTVVKECAIALEGLHGRIVALEQHMAAVAQAPAIASDVTTFEPPAAAPQPLPIVVTPGPAAEAPAEEPAAHVEEPAPAVETPPTPTVEEAGAPIIQETPGA